MSFTVNMNTIGEVRVNAESTSQAVYDAYNQYLQAMVHASDNIINSASGGTTDIENFINALVDLKNLTINGKSDSGGNTFYLTTPMAANVNTLLTVMQSFGLSGDPSMLQLSPSQLSEFKTVLQSLPGLGVDPMQILTAAQNISPGSIHSLQSMIELEYVKRGNDLISGRLSGLEQALSTTSQILSTLALIQNLSNNITVNSPEDFIFPPTGADPVPIGVMATITNTTFQNAPAGLMNALSTHYSNYLLAVGNSIPNSTDITFQLTQFNYFLSQLTDSTVISDTKAITANYQQLYRIFASAHFTQLYPTVPSAAITMANVNALMGAKSALMNQVQILDQANPNQNHTVPGTLSYYIYGVATTISGYLPPSQTNTALKAGLVNWILDNQQKQANVTISGQVGNIQNGISQAITSAQFLNDKQKKDVQNYTFIFQQFYQSASIVLQGVTSIIQGMAQNINTH